MKIIRFLLFVFVGLSSIALAGDKQTVIVLSIDSFRWDYPSLTATPALDHIEDTGVSALSMKPVFPVTTYPNHISMLTGVYPENHGIISNKFLSQYSDKMYNSFSAELVSDPRWYRSENIWTTARRNGLKTASIFWPGSEISDSNMKPDINLPYAPNISAEAKIDSVILWMKLPDSSRPNLICVYFDDVDILAHKYSTKSDHLKKGIGNIDNAIYNLKDSLDALNLSASTNIIVLSDHGMIDIDRNKSIDIATIINDSTCKIQNYGTYAMLDADRDKIDEIYQNLNANSENFEVYLKKNMPKRYHFSNDPNIGEIIIVAKIGWFFSGKGNNFVMNLKALHGYDADCLDMHGIFYATGPAFKQNCKISQASCIDIYPLLCRIFGIYPNRNIDGNIQNLEYILK